MRAFVLAMVGSWAVAGVAFAHPLLEVAAGAEGTWVVSCGEDVRESLCTSDDDCDAGSCWAAVGGPSVCFGPTDAICCFAGTDAHQCAIAEGYDVRCVVVESSGTVRTADNTAFCIYDRAGSTSCADRAATDAEYALACNTTRDGAPAAAVSGDCDRDGVANVQDRGPCDPSVGRGSTPDASLGATWDYRGSGGVTCAIGSRPPPRWLWLAAISALLLRRRRGAISAR